MEVNNLERSAFNYKDTYMLGTSEIIQNPLPDFSGFIKDINPSECTVLIVDDDPDHRNLLEIVINQAGFKTFSAASADECMKIMSKRFIDLVVCDILMPEISGIDFVRSLKAMRTIPRKSSVPVILSTAGNEGTEFEAIKAGADMFCLKKHAQNQLIKQINFLLQ